MRFKKKACLVLVGLLLLQIHQASAAEQIPPSTDVTCSVIPIGVRCGNSVTISSQGPGWTISGEISTEWYLSTLVPGTDATRVINYVNRTFLKKGFYAAGGEDFSYQTLFSAAGNDQTATVLISAIIFNSEGKGSPILGATVHFTLKELSNLMVDASNKAAANKAASDAKAASDKVIADKADKAAADAKAIADKAAADAKAIADKAAADAKAIADKAATYANRQEQTISVTPLVSGPVPLSASGFPVKIVSTSNLSVFAYNSTNNVCIYENGMIRTKTSGRCVIAFSQEGNSEFKPASNLVLDFTIAAAGKKTTIICVKGKLTKKVTGVKPKCPAGYKVKK